MSYLIPQLLAEKAAGFPESSYGACRATLVLRSGEKIEGVTLAWGSEIVRINSHLISSDSALSFNLAEIIDVLPAQ